MTDPSLTQLFALVGAFGSAAAAAWVKDRPALAGKVLLSLGVVLGLALGYARRFEYPMLFGHSVPAIPAGWACDRAKDVGAQQCAGGPGHCYPKPGAHSGPGARLQTGEADSGYCIVGESAIPKNCAWPGEPGVAFDTRLTWWFKEYQCKAPGVWDRVNDRN